MIDPDTITVVTGIPRSGTTLMMRILEAAGIPIYYDDDKPAEFTSKGTDFYNYNNILRETQKLNSLKAGDYAWMDDCKGKAVKILTPAKVKIPDKYNYRFIWMQRKLKHCAKSNQKIVLMNMKGNKLNDLPFTAAVESADMSIIQAYIDEQRREGLKLIKNFPNSTYMIVNFEDLISKTRLVLFRLSRYLNIDINIEDIDNIVVQRPVSCLPRMLEQEIYT